MHPPAGAWNALRWASVAAAAATLLAFVVWLVPPLVNSDSAAVVLLAKELATSGGWVSPDWYYVSDSLMLDGSVHAARIGVMLFGATVAAARFTVATGIVLALLAGVWLGRVLSVRPSHALLATSALLLGPSLIYQDLMLGLPTTFQLALVLAMLACAIRFAVQKGAAWQLVLVGACVLLMSVSAPKKALVYMLVPIVAAAASHSLLDRANARHRMARCLVLVGACVLAWMAGYLAHRHFQHGLFVNTRYARIALVTDPAHMMANLQRIWALLRRFAGGGQDALRGAIACLSIAAWAWLFVAPVSTPASRRSLAGARGFAYGFALAGTCAVFAYLLMYQQIRLYYGIYYLLVTISPVFLLACPAGGRQTLDVRERASQAGIACLLVLGIATTAAACVRFPPGYSGISVNQKAVSAQRAEAIDWLIAHGVRSGFAGYWEANAMTLASGGELQAGPIVVRRGDRLVRRQRWLSNINRTGRRPGNESWFIATYARNKTVLPPACLPADRELVVSAYRLYLYDRPMPRCLSASERPRDMP